MDRTGSVYDYEVGEYTLCPLTGEDCCAHCMLMRRTAFGEPSCSIRVLSDEFVSISGSLKELVNMVRKDVGR